MLRFRTGVFALCLIVAACSGQSVTDVPEPTQEPEAETSPTSPEGSSQLDAPINLTCMNGKAVSLCAVPVYQTYRLMGLESKQPLMLPIAPSEGALIAGGLGGSPPGVTAFSVNLLAGPGAYAFDFLTDEPVYVSDSEGNVFFAPASIFPSTAKAGKTATPSLLVPLQGMWTAQSEGTTMDCGSGPVPLQERDRFGCGARWGDH